jgi:hypothetical protein
MGLITAGQCSASRHGSPTCDQAALAVTTHAFVYIPKQHQIPALVGHISLVNFGLTGLLPRRQRPVRHSIRDNRGLVLPSFLYRRVRV